MENFRTFLENEEFVEYITEAFDKPFERSWSAGKDDVLSTWKQIRTDTPIFMTPVRDTDKSAEKSSYGEDGVRITGSWAFIASILSRLKDLLQFENPNTRLRLVFKGIDGSKTNGRQAFAFYINVANRKGRKPTGL